MPVCRIELVVAGLEEWIYIYIYIYMLLLKSRLEPLSFMAGLNVCFASFALFMHSR